MKHTMIHIVLSLIGSFVGVCFLRKILMNYSRRQYKKSIISLDEQFDPDSEFKKCMSALKFLDNQIEKIHND